MLSLRYSSRLQVRSCLRLRNNFASTAIPTTTSGSIQKKEEDEMLEKIDIEQLPRAQKRFAKQFEKVNMQRVAEIFKKNYKNIRALTVLALLVAAIYGYTIISVTQESFLEEIDEEVATEKPETHGHLKPATPPSEKSWWSGFTSFFSGWF